MVDGVIPRQRLHARLDDARSAGRLTLVVAGAGYGKTSLLRSWAGSVPSAWRTVGPDDRHAGVLARGLVDALRLPVPDLSADIMVAASRLRGDETDEPGGAVATAAALAEALHFALRRPTVLIIDELDEVADSAEAVALVDAMIRHAPPLLHVIVAARDQPPFRTSRLLAHGEASEIGADDLAFTADEAAELCRRTMGAAEPQLVDAVYDLTGGWPVATRLAAEALSAVPEARRLAMLDSLRDPQGVLLRYMADEVVGREPADVLVLLAAAQVLDSIDVGSAAAVGVDDAERVIQRVVRRGVYFEPEPDGSGRLRLRPLFRTYLERHRRPPDTTRRRILVQAAEWHEQAGEHALALTYASRRGDTETAARLLAARGGELVASGAAQVVLDAVAGLPATDVSAEVAVLAGDAGLMLGEWDGALRHYQRAAGSGRASAAVAWRIGLLHYLRGELTEAIGAFDNGDDGDPDLAARALLLAWSASARWIRGDIEGSRSRAAAALLAARESGDHRSLAAAHTVLGMLAAIDGDRAANEAHYLKALDHAGAAHDVLQLVRVHANRSSQRLEEGDAEGTLVEAEVAVRLADLAGLTTFRALALSNRGRALLALGRLDEARAELEASRALFNRLGSTMASYPIAALGDVHMLRGDRSRARSEYQRAAKLSEQVGDAQGLVPALAGLARVALYDSPAEARELIDKALAAGASLDRVDVLVTAARIRLAEGKPDEAISHAEEAARQAEEQRDPAGLAAVTEVLAEARSDPRAARAAVRMRRQLHDPIGAARATLVLARLEDSTERALGLAADVIEVAQSYGAREIATTAQALISELKEHDVVEVSLTCLGGFAVIRRGQAVPASAWQSRKARDLLKVLVCRRGRPIHREQLLELLWPGEDPKRTTNRLSVALSTVRAVLDPEHRRPADHYVRTEGDAITLHRVDIDVERMLAQAASGLARLRAGATADARVDLEAAELAYAGDLFEDDPYSDWAVDLREKARLAYLDVVRALADLAEIDGDADARARYLLRILERDAYDESAHLLLVRLLAEQGRHGEARRRYRLYARQLSEIGVEAAPYPVTAPPRAARSGV
jgi:ATP/maltotriose-dependent transcriptional regulator MalT